MPYWAAMTRRSRSPSVRTNSSNGTTDRTVEALTPLKASTHPQRCTSPTTFFDFPTVTSRKGRSRLMRSRRASRYGAPARGVLNRASSAHRAGSRAGPSTTQRREYRARHQGFAVRRLVTRPGRFSPLDVLVANMRVDIGRRDMSLINHHRQMFSAHDQPSDVVFRQVVAAPDRQQAASRAVRLGSQRCCAGAHCQVHSDAPTLACRRPAVELCGLSDRRHPSPDAQQRRTRLLRQKDRRRQVAERSHEVPQPRLANHVWRIMIADERCLPPARQITA